MNRPVTFILAFPVGRTVGAVGVIRTAYDNALDWLTKLCRLTRCDMTVVKREGRWSDVVQMLYKCFVFAGICDNQCPSVAINKQRQTS